MGAEQTNEQHRFGKKFTQAELIAIGAHDVLLIRELARRKAKQKSDKRTAVEQETKESLS